MPRTRKLVGLTGPSAFSAECMDAVEELLEADFNLLYHNNEENLRNWLDSVDGVIVSGGIDIHPTVYNEAIWNNCNLSKFDLKRDCRELSIIEYCLKHKKPLLGICRGHQLLGIRHGMPFLMDLADSKLCHQPQRQNISTSKNEPTHSVKLINKELFYKIYKMPDPPERQVLREVLLHKYDDHIWVNSFHHQGIAYNSKTDYKQSGIDVLGTAYIGFKEFKSIVEFMQGDNWLSVQWHPEYDWRESTPSRAILERFKTLLNGGA